jgi:hypothetical protein
MIWFMSVINKLDLGFWRSTAKLFTGGCGEISAPLSSPPVNNFG